MILYSLDMKLIKDVILKRKREDTFLYTLCFSQGLMANGFDRVIKRLKAETEKKERKKNE